LPFLSAHLGSRRGPRRLCLRQRRGLGGGAVAAARRRVVPFVARRSRRSTGRGAPPVAVLAAACRASARSRSPGAGTATHGRAPLHRLPRPMRRRGGFLLLHGGLGSCLRNPAGGGEGGGREPQPAVLERAR